MLVPALLGMFLYSLLQVAAEDCPGEKPTKHLLCYLKEVPTQFDPCLCTHLVLQAPLDKLSPKSELVQNARRLRERNPSLRLVLQVAESADVALKKRGGYAQTVAQVVAKSGLDGVEVALNWGKPVAAKVQLVDFVQTLSKELTKDEPKDRPKRDYEIHENIQDDVVTPRWTPQTNSAKAPVRKTREATSTENKEETETTTVVEDKDTSTEEATKQEIEEEEEVSEDGPQIILHLTSEPQHLAKNFDLKRLSKYVSFYTLASDNLTDSTERGKAYHPSRLMGIEDILNADSLVDLVTGLGAPHDKLVLTLPATALRFTLADKDKNMAQSPVTGEPVKISRAELCALMAEGEWTIERDEDLTAPYAFHDTTWLAFDDPTSVSIKGKYVLLRDLAGAGVAEADSEDWRGKCGSSGPALVRTLHDTFTHIARKSRAAQLVDLQEQLHSAGQFSYSGDVHLSPYRIVRVVDRAGSIHVVRKEAKTEFECSRQGYFRHPSGCNRFYRCVKFNQYTPDFTVFEYDCPAGLAFDETVEVCVWPGSLADGGACQGSSEIAPVPRSRYVCPQVAGYYADPENCRWFFACLDHQGDGSPLTAYEFRCPFGLVFDEQALVCNWPWLVPGCGGSGVYTARFTVGDFFEGRHRPSYASLSDVHVSGGRIENVPGGVVLGSAVSGIGSGAYLGSYASGSNALGAGAYSGGAEGSYGGYGGAGAAGDGNGAYLSGDAGSAYLAGAAGTGYVAGLGAGSLASGSYQSNTVSGSGAEYSGSEGNYNAGGSGNIFTSGVGSGTYSAGSGIVTGYSAGAGSGYSSEAGSGSLYSAGAGSGYSAGAGSGLAYSAGAGAGSVYSAGTGAGSAYSSGTGAGSGYSTGAGAGSSYSAGAGAGSGYSAGAGSGLAYSAGAKSGYSVGAEAGSAYSSGAVAGSGYSTGAGSGSSYSSGAGVGSGYSSGASSGLVYSAGESERLGYTAGVGSGLAYTSGSGAYNSGSGTFGTRYNSGNGAGSGYKAGSGKYSASYSGSAGGVGSGSRVYSGASYPSTTRLVGSGAYSYGSGAYGSYSGSYVEDNSGAYIHDNSGDYLHDSTGDTGGLYTGSESYGGQYTGSYIGGGAYVPGVNDNGAYRGSFSSGGQYKGDNVGGGAYTGTYDTGAYHHVKSGGGEYKGGYDSGSYSGKYDTGSYSGKYDSGAYSGKYDGGAYVGDYDSGSYKGTSDAGDYHGGNYYSGGSSYHGGYKVQPVPSTVVTGGHAVQYNGINVEHKPAVNLVGLDAVKVSGGDAYTGGYVSSYVTPSPIPAVSVTPAIPVVSTYSTVTPAPVSVSTYKSSTVQPTTPRPLTYYPVPSSPVTPVTSRPLISYSTVKPPSYVESYEQPSYVKTVTPAVPIYSYSSPAIGAKSKTPLVPLSPVTYKPAVINTNYVSSGFQYNTPSPVSGVSYAQPTYIKSVTPAPTYEKSSLDYAYKGPEYLPPLPSYENKLPATYVKSTEVKYSYPQPAVLQTPVVPLNPIQYSTPAPAIYSAAPLRPVSYSTPAPVAYPTPTVLKTPIVPLNPVQYTTPSPIHFEYSTPSPVKTVSYSTYSTPTPPVSYQPQAPVRPLRPVTYTSPAPVSYEFSTPRPVQPIAPLRPIPHSTPAPFSVEYNVPTVLKTPVVPLNPVQYSTPAPTQFKFSTPAPLRPVNVVRPVTYTTPAPPVSYEYSTPVPVRPVSFSTYSTPAPAVDYHDIKPVVPFIAKAPVVPLNPIQYKTPVPDYGFRFTTPAPLQPISYVKPLRPVAPAVTYSAPAPAPLRPVTYTTPAPAVSYEYSQAPSQPVRPLRPLTYSTPAPAVTYDYSAPAVKPVVPAVYKTPVVPLNPIQYTTPAPVHFEYSTPAPVPLRPLRPNIYSTPSPAINNAYLPPAPVQPVKPLRPITYTTPAPAVSYEYSTPVVPSVSRTPVVPLNPIQYTTPAPAQFEYSTPAPVPLRPFRPVSYSTPSPATNNAYLPPAPVQPLRPLRPITYTTPAPAVSYEYSAPVVPSVLKSPVVPLNPVQYTTPSPATVYFEKSTPAPAPVPLKPIVYSTPAPAVSYEYLPPAPAPAKPITISTPAPFSYNYKYQPVKQVPAVLRTPVVPLNPVQYTTPAPSIVQYTTPAPRPTVSYVKPVVYTTQAPPTVSYEYSTPPPVTYQYKTTPYVKPLPTVLKTPAVPLNPVQYSTSSPIINQYSFGVAYKNPEIQYQPEVAYRRPAVVQTQVVQEGYDYPKPSVKFVETPKVVTTTQAPEVTYSYETPEPVTPVYKQIYNYVKAPMVSAYEKVLNAISYSTTPAPLPVQPVTQSPESFAPVSIGPSYSRPALVKTPSIPVTPVAVVPEYQKVLNVVKATTTPAPLYVNHYTSTYAPDLPSSSPRPVVYKNQPVLPQTTYVKDYSYEENIEDVYDAFKSDFGTRLNGGYEEGYEYHQQKVEVPQVNVYTSTTPAPVAVIKETYRTRKPVKTYTQTYEQPAVAVGYEEGSYEGGSIYSSTPAPVAVIKETYKTRKPVKTYTQTYEQPAVAVGYEEGNYGGGSVYSSTPAPAVVSSSEAVFGAGEQYHKETSFSGYIGHEGDSVRYEEVPQAVPVYTTTKAPTVKITTARVSLPVVTSPRPEGGYYVRKQKVRVRPVVTTENYPVTYSSTFPSTVSTTTFAPYSYSTTPAAPVTFSTTGHPEDEVDVEGEEGEEDGSKILEGYNGQFGSIVSKGGYSVSSTVASIEDGEAIVGVLKKGKITYDGRRTKTKVVVVSKLSDFNPLLVGKLGAECSCDGRSNSLTVRRNKQRGSSRLFTPSRDSTIPDQQLVDTYQTSTTTAAPIVVNSASAYESSSSYESSSYDSPVVEIRPIRKKTRFYSTTTTEPVYTEESLVSETPNFVPAGADRVKADSVECKRAGLFRHPNKCNKFYSCNWDQWKKKFTLHEFKCPIHLAYDINLGACNWPSKGPACAEDSLLV